MEDDQLVQGLVTEALSEGGFEAAIVPSGEEAITLLQSDGTHHRALITDINLLGRLDGWEVAKRARELRHAGNLHDRLGRRRMGITRRAE